MNNLWKEVLVDWVNCTKFMDREYFGLKKISVHEFFRVLRQAQNPHIVQENLLDFIEEQYPKFDVRHKGGHDEDVFIWSLLLHYTCVKYPCEEVRTNSNNLGQNAQLRMAAFFTVLMSQSQINRQALQLAIAEAKQLAIDASTPKLNLSFAESIMPLSPETPSAVSSTNPSPVRGNLSPLRGPLSLLSAEGASSSWSPGNQGCSTPRTKMLDDWRSENRHLKAQIESERDERQFLEGQLKQQEERIDKLVMEKKALTHDLLELKNQKITSDSENISPNKNHNHEQVKRRLLKDLAEKERQIEQLSATVEEAQSANVSLRLRAEHVDKQLHNMEQRSAAQIHMFEEQLAEIEAKSAEIVVLKETNKELESYLREIQRRDREVTMDMSVECVDSSFVSNYNDDRSVAITPPAGDSPQNLAHTVVDVQLREAQLRNQQLLDQCDRERQEAADALAKQEALLNGVRKELDELRQTNETMKATCALDHLQKMAELGEAMEALQHEHDQSVSLHHLDLECARTEATDLMDQVTRLNSVNQDLVLQIGEKDVLIDTMDKETQALIEQKQTLSSELAKLNDLVTQIGDNLTEHQRIKSSMEAEEARLHDCMRSLQNQVEILTRAKDSLTAENEDVRKQLCEVQTSLNGLNEKLANTESKAAELLAENERLTKSENSLQSALKSAETHREQINEKLANMKTMHEDQIIRIAAETAKCMELGQQLEQSSCKLNRLESENSALRSQHEDLTGTVQKLELAALTFEQSSRELNASIGDIKLQHDRLQAEVVEKEAQMESLNASNRALMQNVGKLQQELAVSCQHLEESQNSYQQLQSQLEILSVERNKLKTKTEEMGQRLNAQRNEFDQTNGALRQEIADNERSLSQMRDELMAISDSLTADCKENDQLRSDKEALAMELGATNSELAAAVLKLATSKSEHEAAISKLASTELELEATVSKLAATDSKLAVVSNELQLLREQHQTMSNDLQTKVDEIQSLEQKCGKWEAECNASAAKIRDLQKDQEVQEKNAKNLHQEKTDLEQRLGEHAKEMFKLENDLQNYAKQIADMKTSHTQVETAFKAQIVELKSQLKTQQEEHDKNAQVVASLKGTIGHLEAQKVEMTEKQQAAIVSIETSKKDLENRLADKDEHVSRQLTIIDDLHLSLDQAQVELGKLSAKHNSAIQTTECQMKEMNKQIIEVQEKCEQCIEETNQIKEVLSRTTLERDTLFATGLKKEEEITRLQTDAEQLQVTIKQLQADINNANETLEREIHSYTTTIYSLNDHVKSLNDEISKSQNKYTELSQCYENTQIEHKNKVDELMLLTDQLAAQETKSAELKAALQESHKIRDELIATHRTKTEEQEHRLQQSQLAHEAALETKSHELESALDAQNRVHDELVAKLRQQIDELTRKIDQLELLQTESTACVDALKLEVKSSQSSIAALTEVSAEVEQLRSDRQQVEQQAKHLTQEIDALQREQQRRLIELETEKEDLKKKVCDSESKNSNLEKEIELERDQTRDVQCQLSEASERCSEISGRLNEAQESNVALIAEKENLAQKLTEMRNEIASQSVLLTEHQEKAGRYEEALEDIRQSATQCRAELQVSSEQMRDLNEKLKMAESTNEALNEEHSKVTAQLESVLEQQGRVAKELADNADMVAKLNSEKTSLNATIAELSDRIQQLQSDKLAIKKELEIAEELARSTGQKQMEHQASSASLQNELDEMLKSLKATESERDRLRDSDAEHLKHSEEANTRLRELSAEYAGQNRLLMQQTELIIQKSSEIQMLRQKLDDQASKHDASLAEYREQVKTTETELKAQQAHLKDALAKVEDLNQKLLEGDIKNTELTESLKAHSIEVDRLKDEHNSIQQQLSENVEKCDGIKKDKSVLEVKIVKSTEVFNRLEMEKVALADQVQSLQEKCVGLESSIETITRLQLENETLLQNAKTLQERIAELEPNQVALFESHKERDQLIATLAQALALSETPTKENIVEELKRLQTSHSQVQTIISQNDELNDRIEGLTEKLAKTSIHCEELERGTRNDLDKQVIELQQKLDAQEAEEKARHMEIKALLAADAEHKKSNAIIRAKLIKERETAAAAESAWQQERLHSEALLKMTEARITETRSELEGKLEKMKTRMKSLYTDESRKIKAKHDAEVQEQQKRYEQQVFEMRSENHTMAKTIAAHETHIRKLSSQIFQLNDQALELKTSNEAMKTKLRFIENNPHAMRKHGGRDSRMLPSASSMSSLRMEDEEGEQFCNTYLDELLTGRPSSISGSSSALVSASHIARESASVPLSELKFRNSMLPQHLRSSYAVQYGDTFSSEDDIKGPASLPADDSMFSTQSETRRGTLYQKPGPPTPSKHGGRLSFGGGGMSGQRLSMDPGSSALMVRHEPNFDMDPTPSKSPPPPPSATTSKLRSFFGGSDKPSRRGDETDYSELSRDSGRMSGHCFSDYNATSTPIKQWPRREGDDVQRALTVRQLDPILFTSTFFDSNQLRTIASYNDDRRCSISPPDGIPTTNFQSSVVFRRKEPRQRDVDHRKSNREKARNQRIQLFNNARALLNECSNHSQTEIVEKDAVQSNENLSYTFTVSQSNEPTLCFKQLLAEQPNTESEAEEGIFCHEAILTIPEANTVAIVERTVSSPSSRTRNVSAMSSPSFRVGLLPRRLDRSLTPLQNSRLSTDSLDFNSIASSNDSVDTLAVNEQRSKLLVTTVSLMAICYAWLNSLLDV